MGITEAIPVPNENTKNIATASRQANSVVSKGSSFQTIHLASNILKGDQIAIRHNATRIVLQMQHQSSDEDNILGSSFQVAFELTPGEALALASTLLALATPRIHSALSQLHQPRDDAS
jgi:hypothetical protein